jgi:hypothetical protein
MAELFFDKLEQTEDIGCSAGCAEIILEGTFPGVSGTTE